MVTSLFSSSKITSRNALGKQFKAIYQEVQNRAAKASSQPIDARDALLDALQRN